jgi:4-aminobutyrate aminotransferase-like enzyme
MTPSNTDLLEFVAGPIPGPRSHAFLATSARYEARGVTYIADDYPVVWESAHGALVTDVDGNRYLDLTAAFAVAALGHNHPAVTAAIVAQAGKLVHGMGDVHPSDVKIALMERLAALSPGDCSRCFFSQSGGEAIEFALKTALLATGRPHVIAYRGAYHGLNLGALKVGGIERFRTPFAALVDPRASWLSFPDAHANLDEALARLTSEIRATNAGAVILEPIQGRGGVIVPPTGFLAGVRAVCNATGAVLILDEIYTGFGRTGTMFACDREGVVPDILCVGKALAGGVPFSAAIGRPAIVDAWPESTGEALHTSTFLGNPLACASALAVLDVFERDAIVASVAAREPRLRAQLEEFRSLPGVSDVRGRGMLWALEFRDGTLANEVVRGALQRGVIALQSGTEGTSITLAPPLLISERQLDRALELLSQTIKERA